MDYSPPGSSVHGISQARILEWVAISFSRGSSQPRDQIWVSCIAGRFFTNWATRKISLKTIKADLTKFMLLASCLQDVQEILSLLVKILFNCKWQKSPPNSDNSKFEVLLSLICTSESKTYKLERKWEPPWFLLFCCSATYNLHPKATVRFKMSIGIFLAYLQNSRNTQKEKGNAPFL